MSEDITMTVERSAPVKNDGNNHHPPEFPFDTPTKEQKVQTIQYQAHITEITKHRIDYGQSIADIGRWQKHLPNFYNLSDGQKQKVLAELKQERESLAIMNFPNYISIWGEINPEDEEQISKANAAFHEADQTDEIKAKISEDARETVNDSIRDKEVFYTEMITTIYLDSGIPHKEAIDLAGSKSSELQRTSAIHEKADLLRAHKKQALNFLISTLDYSLRVWEELYPGTSETEKSRIMSESSEAHRRYLAKELYKNTQAELQKRKDKYHQALELNLHKYGPISYIDNPWLDAETERKRLDSLPRLEQIRTLKHFEKLDIKG